jgi:hypothetical protein
MRRPLAWFKTLLGRHVQIDGRRTLPSLAVATTASSSINPLLYIVTNLWIRHRIISIIATIKVRYGAAILNDARRLECPKHLSLTSSSAP